MGVLTREQLLAARSKVPHKLVHVPHLGGDVRVSALTINRRNALVEAYNSNVDAYRAYEENRAKPADERQNLAPVVLHDHVALFLCFALSDENGDQLLTVDDLDILNDIDINTLAILKAEFDSIDKAPTSEAIDAKKKRSATTRRR